MIKKIAIYGTLILCTLLLVYCTTDEESIIGPFGNANKYITATSFSADKTLLYSNGDTTVVKIKILDVDKTPAVGLVVDFSADFGTITESDTTDSSGVALATFVTDDNTGENIIIADTGVKKYEIPIQVVHYKPKYVELFAESPMLLADGASSTKIIAVLKDSIGMPMPDITVRFATTAGTLSSQIGITDENGEVSTELTSTTSDGTALVTATSFVTNFVEVEFKQYVPAQLEVLADDLVLLADGNDYTKIIAIPRDENGNIMINIPILFSSTLGTLSSEEGTFGNTTFLIANSGNSGREATVYLRSTVDGGKAQVTASSYVTNFIEVYFQKYVPAFIEISAGSALLPNDGISSTTITAAVKDSTGKVMPDVTVRFATTAGTISSTADNTNQRNITAITDEEGKVQITLFSSTSEETAFVTASSYVTSLIEIKFSENVPSSIDISASPTLILADGISVSTITAIPKDVEGNTMPGLAVNFNTTHGTLSEVVKVTDVNGIATVDLTSSSTEGTAIVTATSAISRSVGVQFIAYNPTLINLEVSENSILGDGVSETAIVAKVFDASNQVIPGAVIDFSTNYGSLSKTTNVIANQVGEASTTLISEGIQGDDQRATVLAEVRGSSLVDSISVRLRGISLVTHTDSVEFAEDGIYIAYIRTEMIETSNGRPIEESAVKFESNLGIMNPEISGTNDFGQAFSIFEAEVTTVDQTNVIITSELSSAEAVQDTTQPMTVPGVEIIISSPDNELISVKGGDALIQATLRESNGNATIGETAINWSIEPIGTISTSDLQTITDIHGVTIGTFQTEEISANTSVTVSANYGDHVTDSYNLTFLTPPTVQSLVIGTEPDTTGTQPADSLFPGDRPAGWESGTRDIFITAFFTDASGNPIGGETIQFSIVPTTTAVIWPSNITVLDDNGRAEAVLSYKVQAGGNYDLKLNGELVRIWGDVPAYGARGSTDVELVPILPATED